MAIQDSMTASRADLEPKLGRLADDVQAAENALLQTFEGDRDREWSPRALQAAATNGWSAAVVSIAFWRLVSSGRLKVEDDRRVRDLGNEPA